MRIGDCGGASPLKNVVAVERETKDVRRDESDLAGAETDYTDDGTVGSGENPSLPIAAADKDGGENSKKAGSVIEAEQGVAHVWL